jgi:hypothetical protein
VRARQAEGGSGCYHSIGIPDIHPAFIVSSSAANRFGVMRSHSVSPVPTATCISLVIGFAVTCPTIAPAQEAGRTGARAAQAAAIAIPAAMKAEHDAIHHRLVLATEAPGRTGEAARRLAKVLHPHFVREEQIALPPLGLLAPLASGPFTPEMAAVLPLTDSLRAELPRMLEEHKAIHAATKHLAEVARAESNAEAEDLAMTLADHAEAEEQLFYPAALLVGEIVRTRLATHRR